jgi:leucyl/phenylalanyl-tRNA---protein transferase
VIDVPFEPPPSRWDFGDPQEWPEHDLVGVGADLEPGTLLAAYRRGLFPMPSGAPGQVAWFSPVTRGVLPLDAMRVTRSLLRSARDVEVRVDSAYDQVVQACADPRRPGGWIDDDIRAAYLRLHELGWAHSVEVWEDGELAGGLYGVAIGGLFAGESMFFRRRDASKVALLGLVSMLREAGGVRVLDVQWRTPHLASLGVVELPRAAYLAQLGEVLATPLPPAFEG